MALQQLTHHTARIVLGLLLGLSALLTGCGGGGGGGASNNPPVVSLSSITINATSTTLNLGASTTLTATGHYSDSSTANISTQVSWSSGSNQILTVGAGTATFNSVGVGATTITASMNQVSSLPLSITVVAPTSINATPASTAIGIGTIVNLSAVGINGSTISTLTSLVSWSTSDSTIASVTSTGIVTGIGAGTATITATFTGLPPATATVTVSTGLGGQNLATSRFDHTANLLSTGKILVAGGYVTGPSDTIKTTELYDPATATWTTAAPLITERGDFTATELLDHTILVAGGANSMENNIPSTELYDPQNNTWNLTLVGVPGYMVTPRTYHSATLLQSGKVLVAGGSSASISNLTDAELYDPGTKTWTATRPISIGRYSQTATPLQNGKVLIVGGYGGTTTNTQNPLPLGSAEIYDPATETWTQAANLHVERANHTATLLSNGMVLVVGGETLSSVVLSSAELYDPANNTWTQINSLGNAREWHTATLLSDGLSVMVIGGVNAGSEVMPIEVYNSSTGTWASAASLNTGRDTFTATLIPSTGKVLVVGGYNFPSSSSLNSVELH